MAKRHQHFSALILKTDGVLSLTPVGRAVGGRPNRGWDVSPAFFHASFVTPDGGLHDIEYSKAKTGRVHLCSHDTIRAIRISL